MLHEQLTTDSLLHKPASAGETAFHDHNQKVFVNLLGGWAGIAECSVYHIISCLFVMNMS